MTAHSKVPVAFFIHSRPSETAQALESIRGYKPETLYVVADGPRTGLLGEAESCLEAREVVDSVDWECDVHWLRRDTNFGSGRSVKEGLDWVFSREERAIILEDDTVPNSSFFSYCEELLFRYQDQPEVGMISGNNLIHYPSPGDASYFFSQIPTTWGWATWRRAWDNNDFHMTWLTPGKGRLTRNISVNRRHFHYWRWAIGLIQEKKVDAWDWQWNASLALHGQLTVVPSSNLVSNIGFGEGATHTRKVPRGMKLETSSLSFPMSHPRAVETCSDYEKQLIRRFLPDRRPEKVFLRWVQEKFTLLVLNPVYRAWRSRSIR